MEEGNRQELGRRMEGKMGKGNWGEDEERK